MLKPCSFPMEIIPIFRTATAVLRNPVFKKYKQKPNKQKAWTQEPLALDTSAEGCSQHGLNNRNLVYQCHDMVRM